MQKFKTNILIFWLAILLSVSLFYVTENTAMFSASILSLQDEEIIKAKSRDIWYKNEWNILDTFLSDKLDGISSITFSVIYDNENVELDLKKLDSQTEYEIVSANDGGVVIKFTNFSGIDYDYRQSLFELPFTGDKWTISQILISEWTVNLFNWENKNLSIWLLNSENNTHSN